MNKFKCDSGREWNIAQVKCGNSAHSGWVDFVTPDKKVLTVFDDSEFQTIGLPVDLAPDLPQLVAHAQTILKGEGK